MENLVSHSSVDERMQLFGSFYLCGIELALPASVLQEVVNYPSSVTRVPMAPKFLLGLFNLRGALIPIVHLSQLLELPDTSVGDESKIAIIDVNGARVGLLFDHTGEILRVSRNQVIPFAQSSEHGKMIEGAIKLDDGNRILQVLGASTLALLRNIPQPQQANDERQHVGRRMGQGHRQQSVLFQVCGARMALPMKAIQEILRVPELQRSVLNDELCLGFLNLRGHTVPVIDFARFLRIESKGAEPAVQIDDERRIILIKQQDVHLGLLVDEVDSIIAYSDSELLPIPSFNHDKPALFSGCISNGNEADVILVDPDVLKGNLDFAELTAGHLALYEAVEQQADDTHSVHPVTRETYITFKLNRIMGLRIEQLREVIDYSHELIQPPGAPDYVRGILNLRQKLVTVVDLRSLYSMNAVDDMALAKILIVEENGEKYGLVVDAIQNIVTISSADKMHVPTLLLNQLDNELHKDLRDVVEMADHTTVLLLDAAPLVQRLGGHSVH